jgi:hypothetical protein
MQHVTDARSIMRDFARSTGLSDTSRKPRRYLWTDAFAVCNFLELYRHTSDGTYLQLARSLVDQVHSILGRYSDEDSRSGWISGLDDQAGYQHPTLGGLRIGKQLCERKPDEPINDRLEWDRDGQYLHYLTKWMQALTRMAAVTGDLNYQRWAVELASAALTRFIYRPPAGGPKRMYWKMSIDLSRPLVASMGHHDPLDALLTCMELEVNGGHYGFQPGDIDLLSEIADCQVMCVEKTWATDDPLGTGGLLVDAFRLAQIEAESSISAPVQLARLLADCETGLEAFLNSGVLDYPAQYRLAFRELGLATGLHAIIRLRSLTERNPGTFLLTEADRAQLGVLSEYSYLSGMIENFWLQPAHRKVGTWCDHLDINSVMLATSLSPDAYLLSRPDAVIDAPHKQI